MQGQTIEWAPFRMRAGVTEAELLEAASAIQGEFLEQQDGFVRRELLRGAGDTWCDLLYWRDAEAAQRAMEAAMQNPACARYFGMMQGVDHEDPGAGLLHFEVRRSFSAGAGAAV